MTVSSCGDVLTRDGRRELDVLGGRRRRPAGTRRRTRCCPSWLFAGGGGGGQPDTADSAALYECSYAQRTLVGSAGGCCGAETGGPDKRLRPSRHCLIRDGPAAAPLPPLLPPPPVRSPDDLTWTRLHAGVDHHDDDFCVHCPPSSATRHLLVPAAAILGDLGAPQPAVHYYTSPSPSPPPQLLASDNDRSLIPPTSAATPTEHQLYRPLYSRPCRDSIS